MPPEFDQLSLEEILMRYTTSLGENTGIRIIYTPTPGNASRSLPNETAYELYRIVQELTANIIKHTNADYISIQLQTSNSIHYTLEITNNGTPILPPSSKSPDGIGLRTLNDRITTIHATVHEQTYNKKNIFTLTFDIS